MKSNLARVLGLGLGVLALSACSPVPSGPGYSVSFTSDAFEADPVPMSFQVTAAVEGGFTLGTSACDPTLVSVDADYVTIVPEWDPYACTNEDTSLVDPAHGNIQYFVDGIFMGTYYSDTIDIDLTPKGDGTDIKFMLYDYSDDDADGYPDDLNSDGAPDIIEVCNFYFPGDNLGYAWKTYNDLMKTGNMWADYGGGSVYDLYGIEIAEADQSPLYDGFFPYIGYFPWTNFEHFGVNLDELAVQGAEFDPEVDGQHIFYGELHYDNHSPVYGAGRTRSKTGVFDLSAMPADWCPTVLGVPYGNPGSW